jgi:hypothetical protein
MFRRDAFNLFLCNLISVTLRHLRAYVPLLGPGYPALQMYMLTTVEGSHCNLTKVYVDFRLIALDVLLRYRHAAG